MYMYICTNTTTNHYTMPKEYDITYYNGLYNCTVK